MDNNKFVFTNKRLNELTEVGRYYDAHPKANALHYQIRTQGKPGKFKVKYRHKNQQLTMTIGQYPHITIEQARNQASKIQADFFAGLNPNEKKLFERTKQMTLKEGFEHYLTLKKLSQRTVQGYESSFRLVLSPLANKTIPDITYNDVQKCHKAYALRSVAEADRAMRLLRAIFNMAMDEMRDLQGRPLILENPVSKLARNKHMTRLERKTSKLEDDQIKPFLDCFEKLSKDKRPFYQMGANLALILFYHGTRITETARLEWSQVDFKYKRFYLSDTKSGRRLWLPMTSESEKIFLRCKKRATGSHLVFPSITDTSKPISDIKKPLKHLLEETGIKMTAHDFRRTFLSMGSRIGLSDYLLKQLANHATAANDVTAGYVIQSAEALKEPSQKITDALLEKGGRQVKTNENQLHALIEALPEAEKHRLLIRLLNQQQTA